LIFGINLLSLDHLTSCAKFSLSLYKLIGSTKFPLLPGGEDRVYSGGVVDCFSRFVLLIGIAMTGIRITHRRGREWIMPGWTSWSSAAFLTFVLMSLRGIRQPTETEVIFSSVARPPHQLR